MKYLLGAIQTAIPGFGDDLLNILEGAQPAHLVTWSIS